VKLGQNSESNSVTRKGVDLDPFNAVFQKKLVLRFIEMKDYTQAGAALKRYVETFPQDSFHAADAQPCQLQGTAEMSGVRWPAAGFRPSLISTCIFSAALLASSRPASNRELHSRIARKNRA